MAMAMTITLKEAGTGVEKEIVLDRLAPCDVCGGSGSSAGSSVVTCPDCGGSGQRVTVRRTFLGNMQTAALASAVARQARSSRSRARSARARDACPTASTCR